MLKKEFCGKQASVIALGTMDFGGKIAPEKAWDFMDAYVEMGGNFIDTARLYGDFVRGIQGLSEEVIGGWMAQRHNRDALVLVTKGAHPDLTTMHIGRLDRENIVSDISRSLDALQTDCVDAYFLHRDDRSRSVEDILTTLTELVERGMTKSVGVSNWTPERIAEAQACADAHHLVHIAADQPQFSLAPQVVIEDTTLVQMDAQLHRLHTQTQLPCMCFTSQAKGFLSKMASGGEASLGDKAKRRYLCPENIALLARAQKVAAETGYSVNAVALAYLTHQPFPCFPIAGASKIEQVLAIREAGDARLTAAQVAYLRKFDV